jgi:uncharacterized delta-60 repeat protein
MKIKLLVMISVAFLRYASVICQPGTLDSDFDADGIVTTSFGDNYAIACGVAIQDDHKIVVSGALNNNVDYDVELVRYNTDGTLDNSFGINGKVTAPVGSLDDYGMCIALLDNMKILVGGFYSSPAYLHIFLLKFNSDGSPDTTFGNKGTDTLLTGMSDDIANAIAIQPDGKILLSGYSSNGSDNDFLLVRFNPDGSPDSTFGTDGKVITNVGGSNDVSYSIGLQTDGKILLGGTAYNGMYDDMAVVRYNTDGSVDSTFNVDGKVFTSIKTSGSSGHSLAVQSDGKIVIAGDYNDNAFHNMAVARYNTNGTLDHTFNQDGKSTITIEGESINYCTGMTVEQDGKIVVTGVSQMTNGSDYDICLVRFNSDGSVDSSFGTHGSVIKDINNHSDDTPTAVIMQPDGRIVVLGYSGGGNFVADNLVVLRYLSGLDLTNLTSLTNQTADNGILRVYPNPVTGNFRITYSLQQDENITMALYNMQGNLIKQLISDQRRLAGENEEIINLDKQLPPGTYILRLNSGSVNYTGRIIVQ